MKKIINISLAGNPNTGKTSIFNALTGQHQHVGNWPGVTVEKKEGKIFEDDINIVNLVDLPGIYSLRASSQDEVVASDFLIKKHPDMTVVILDASRLERSLYLYKNRHCHSCARLLSKGKSTEGCPKCHHLLQVRNIKG